MGDVFLSLTLNRAGRTDSMDGGCRSTHERRGREGRGWEGDVFVGDANQAPGPYIQRLGLTRTLQPAGRSVCRNVEAHFLFTRRVKRRTTSKVSRHGVKKQNRKKEKKRKGEDIVSSIIFSNFVE